MLWIFGLCVLGIDAWARFSIFLVSRNVVDFGPQIKNVTLVHVPPISKVGSIDIVETEELGKFVNYPFVGEIKYIINQSDHDQTNNSKHFWLDPSYFKKLPDLVRLLIQAKNLSNETGPFSTNVTRTRNQVLFNFDNQYLELSNYTLVSGGSHGIPAQAVLLDFIPDANQTTTPTSMRSTEEWRESSTRPPQSFSNTTVSKLVTTTQLPNENRREVTDLHHLDISVGQETESLDKAQTSPASTTTTQDTYSEWRKQWATTANLLVGTTPNSTRKDANDEVETFHEAKASPKPTITT